MRAAAKAYADSIDTAAVIIVHEGVAVSQWVATTTKFNVHSIRNSFLSALYGIAVGGLLQFDTGPIPPEPLGMLQQFLPARSSSASGLPPQPLPDQESPFGFCREAESR